MSNTMWGGRFAAGRVRGDGGDQRLDRFRPQARRPGYRRLPRPISSCSPARASLKPPTPRRSPGVSPKSKAKSRRGHFRSRARSKTSISISRRGLPKWSARRPGGCTPRARATTRSRSISASGCATRSTGARPDHRAATALLAARGARQRGRVMPGFTHLQSAQPVTFGHHLLAYVEMLGRDRGRLQGCAQAPERMSARRGALAGTSFPIDSRHDRKGARLRPADRQFARQRRRPRLRARSARGHRDRRDASLPLRRGDRAVDDAVIRLRQAFLRLLDRLLDHAAEAQPRCGRTGARQDRPRRRRTHRPAYGHEGPAARLFKGHAGGQGRRVRRLPDFSRSASPR